MTHDEIIHMAREAGFNESVLRTPQDVERFAVLVITAKRQAFTQLCDLAISQCYESMNQFDETELVAKRFFQDAINQLEILSKTIAARGLYDH